MGGLARAVASGRPSRGVGKLSADRIKEPFGEAPAWKPSASSQELNFPRRCERRSCHRASALCLCFCTSRSGGVRRPVWGDPCENPGRRPGDRAHSGMGPRIFLFFLRVLGNAHSAQPVVCGVLCLNQKSLQTKKKILLLPSHPTRGSRTTFRQG